MAKRIIPVLALITTTACYAGETYFEPAPAPAPAPSPSLWNWFVGGGVGFFDKMDDEYYSVHIGAEKFSGNLSHAFFVEVGWAGDDSQDEYYEYVGEGTFLRRDNADVDILPISLNYKLEGPLFSDSFHWYIGGGVGAVYGEVDWSYYTEVNGDWAYDGGSSDDDWSFMGQVFAGVTWNLTEAFEIYGGGRWMYFDGILDSGSDDDFMGEVGLRFNF